MTSKLIEMEFGSIDEAIWKQDFNDVITEYLNL